MSTLKKEKQKTREETHGSNLTSRIPRKRQRRAGKQAGDIEEKGLVPSAEGVSYPGRNAIKGSENSILRQPLFKCTNHCDIFRRPRTKMQS